MCGDSSGSLSQKHPIKYQQFIDQMIVVSKALCIALVVFHCCPKTLKTNKWPSVVLDYIFLHNKQHGFSLF